MTPGGPGIRSTEFYLKLLAIVITALMGSGVLPAGSNTLKIVTVISVMLGALGYTVARSMVKISNGASNDNAAPAAPTTKAAA